MIIAYSEFGASIEIKDYQPLVLIVENKKTLVQLIHNIKEEIDGTNSMITISEKEKTFKASKDIVLIVDPWSVDINCKIIKTKLFQLMTDISSEYVEEEFLKLRTEIFQYIETVSEHIMYDISYNFEIDPNTIFKSVDIGINNRNLDFIDCLVEYIKLLQSLCGIKVCSFLNLKRYLSVEEISLLYKEAIYLNLQLILIEDFVDERNIEEKVIIIDRDNCIIEL